MHIRMSARMCVYVHACMHACMHLCVSMNMCTVCAYIDPYYKPSCNESQKLRNRDLDYTESKNIHVYLTSFATAAKAGHV